MDNFVNKSFYEDKFLQGKQAVITTAFDFYARKATKIINQRTFGNIEMPTDEVKMCCCEVAELLFQAEQAERASLNKTSESVGGWSVSYRSDEELKKALNYKIKSVIITWLSGTGLLYRGVNNACKY